MCLDLTDEEWRGSGARVTGGPAGCADDVYLPCMLWEAIGRLQAGDVIRKVFSLSLSRLSYVYIQKSTQVFSVQLHKFP